MAVTLDAAALATAIGVETAVAVRLLAVAIELVNMYAPMAPASVADEAALRTAGFLSEHSAAAIRRESIGDIATSYAPANVSALRHSGAAALLSPWRRRRGGII